MQRHHDVDVVEELGQLVGLLGQVASRWQVVRIVNRMAQEVDRCAGLFCSALGDHVSHLFKTATMNGHKSESGSQGADFVNGGISQ